MGTHLVKAGAEFRLYRLLRQNVGNNNGQFDFSTGFTQRDPNAGDSASGNAVASLLLGYPANGDFGGGNERDERWRRAGQLGRGESPVLESGRSRRCEPTRRRCGRVSSSLPRRSCARTSYQERRLR